MCTSTSKIAFYLRLKTLFISVSSGFTFGWNVANADYRKRNISTDVLLDTLTHLQRTTVPHAWEIAGM